MGNIFLIVSTIITAIFWYYILRKIRREKERTNDIEDYVRTLWAEKVKIGV